MLEPGGWVRMRIVVDLSDGREASPLDGILDLDEIVLLRRDGSNARPSPGSSDIAKSHLGRKTDRRCRCTQNRIQYHRPGPQLSEL
jgi:hypothetical protein